MEVVISLCNTVQIDGTDNEFYNQVKFNPTHRADVGPWNVTLNCIEWTQFIVQYYENCPLPSNQKMETALERFPQASIFASSLPSVISEILFIVLA